MKKKYGKAQVPLKTLKAVANTGEKGNSLPSAPELSVHKSQETGIAGI